MHHVRYALRQLRHNPGFALVAILTLALGIGANTAIFSVLDGIVLSPLPYREPDRLVLIALYNRALKYPTALSYPDFLDWQRTARSFQQIAAYKTQSYDLTSPGAPEHVNANEVSASFFSTLGVQPALGRAFSADEDRSEGPPAAIISDRLWRDRFSASPGALGKPITLSGAGYTVVGVLRPDFRYGDRQADVYTALGHGDPLIRTNRTFHDIVAIGRLNPSISLGQALAEMNTLQDEIDELNPATERGLGTYIVPLKQFLIGDISSTLLLLLGAVGLVLLIACANVANLLLARSAVRTREFAVRLALGASRAQIVRQLITESLLLSLIGGAAGLGIAKWGLNAVLADLPTLPRIENIRLNPSVLLFAFAISTAVGIVFGLLPALKSSNTDLQTGLKEGSRGSSSGHHRTQGALVIFQIALTLVLLTGGSLLVRTIHNLLAVNPGFNVQRLLSLQVGLPPTANTPAKVRIAYQQLAEHIRQIPGVEAADITALLPLGQHDNSGPFWIGSRQPASMAEIPRAVYYPIGPDYLRTMGIPLLRGRVLSRADTSNSGLVVVIDSLLARTYFPDRDPLGQSLTMPDWGAARNVAARIVGVAGHVEQYGLDGSVNEKPQIYYSFYQLPDEALPAFRPQVTLVVRTPLPSAALLPALKAAVYQAGSDQPIYNIAAMQSLVSESMAGQRLPMILLSSFAALALVLATVGIYGVISYSMNQRVREIGIRMALGAVKRDVLRMVVAHGMRLALAGVAIGLVAQLILARVLLSFSHLLYGVRATDPWTFLAVSLVLIGAAIAACYLPARRAAALDPLIALRQE